MPSLHRIPRARQAAALLGVLLLLIAVNFQVNAVRAPVIGQYPGPGDAIWRTNLNQALAMSRSLLNAGVAKNRFTLHFMRPKIEDPAPGSPYVSYPPGFAFFPYLVAKLTGGTLEPEHLSLWGSLCHFTFALLASLIAFLTTRAWGAGLLAAAPLAALVGSLALLAPSAVIFFPFAWWADILVLPFFIALVALELFAPASGRWWRALRVCLVVLGVLSDWLFFLLLLCLVVKDRTSRPKKFRAELILFPLAYLAWHVWTAQQAGMMGALLAKMEFRAGWKDQEISLARGLWFFWHHLDRGLGTAGAVLAVTLLGLTPILTLLFFRRHRYSPRFALWTEAAFLLCGPVFLHLLLLHQHYYEHPYEVLKYTALVPLFWLALVPAPAFPYLRRPLHQCALVLFLGLASWGVAKDYPRISKLAFAVPFNVDPVFQQRCLEVYRNSVYEDISFSPDFATLGPLPLDKAPPSPKVSSWGYVISDRNIYLSEQPKDVKGYFEALQWKERAAGAPYRFKLWTVGKPSKEWEKYLVQGTGIRTGTLWVHELSRDIVK